MPRRSRRPRKRSPQQEARIGVSPDFPVRLVRHAVSGPSGPSWVLLLFIAWRPRRAPVAIFRMLRKKAPGDAPLRKEIPADPPAFDPAVSSGLAEIPMGLDARRVQDPWPQRA